MQDVNGNILSLGASTVNSFVYKLYQEKETPSPEFSLSAEWRNITTFKKPNTLDGYITIGGQAVSAFNGTVQLQNLT